MRETRQAWQFKEIQADLERRFQERQAAVQQKREEQQARKLASDNQLEEKLRKLPPKCEKRENALRKRQERRRDKVVAKHVQEKAALRSVHKRQRDKLLRSVMKGANSGTGKSFRESLKTKVAYDNALSGTPSKRGAVLPPLCLSIFVQHTFSIKVRGKSSRRPCNRGSCRRRFVTS